MTFTHDRERPPTYRDVSSFRAHLAPVTGWSAGLPLDAGWRAFPLFGYSVIMPRLADSFGEKFADRRLNMRMIRVTLAAFVLFLPLAGRADAAPPHTISWSPKSANPGQVVMLGGQQFIGVRIPVRDLGSSRRFSISFLGLRQIVSEIPLTRVFVPATVTTLHSTEPLVDPVEIDGFAARIGVSDGRHYTVAENFATPPGVIPDYTFQVIAHAGCTATIKLGQTLVTIGTTIQVIQQDVTAIGVIPNALPYAEWADYVHPGAQITGCNNWVDYIRIREL